MQKHGQLGLGLTGSNYSFPRIVKTFTDCMIYKMGCGGYHSACIIGEVIKNFNNSIYVLTKNVLDTLKIDKNNHHVHKV